MHEGEARDGHSGNCTQAAIDDFPVGVFTREQLESGGIILHCLVSLYLFVSLAVVCDRFFVPAVDKICHALKMSNDVAGATFMAAATSAPELFVNVIGTFITEGDIGVGTIVGSAVFNILAVAACCGIGAGMVVPLDWWPLTRDCVAYGFTVSVLICIIHDERVEWYEALILVLLYGLYIAIMLFDKPIQRCARGSSKHFRKLLGKKEEHPYDANDAETIESKMPLQSVKISSSPDHQQHNGSVKSSAMAAQSRCSGDASLDRASEVNLEVAVAAVVTDGGRHGVGEEKPIGRDVEAAALEVDVYRHSLWKWPSNRSCFTKTAWVITWPIHLVFMFTIPDCQKERYKKWFPLTFVMCIVWIGSLSYIVAWMITIIGDTLKIPDSVMGITFLAAGTSVPEAVSSVIVAKQGHGSMGISNSIGSNTFDILLCLGLPWLIKSAFTPTIRGQNSVEINSSGLEYSAISLLSTLLMLYIAFYFNKFKLDKAVGVSCLCMYAVFLILATLIELNVFFPVNKPTCGV